MTALSGVPGLRARRVRGASWVDREEASAGGGHDPAGDGQNAQLRTGMRTLFAAGSAGFPQARRRGQPGLTSATQAPSRGSICILCSAARGLRA
ncbi:MAG: hypothetical protein ACRDRW_04780 [Pseudonocardiaceae bacterium]